MNNWICLWGLFCFAVWYALFLPPVRRLEISYPSDDGLCFSDNN